MSDSEISSGKIKPALLVIDVQGRYLAGITARDKELAFYYINLFIGLFRKHNLPIIRIYHKNEETGPIPGSEDFNYPSQVQIRDEDIQVIKTYSDSFNKTELDEILRGKGINTLFLCGLSAVGCVMATRTGAFNHNYKPFILKDAIMSHDTAYTKNIEIMFDAVSYDVVTLIVENSI
jgi:nicotinamidase-related amidase